MNLPPDLIELFSAFAAGGVRYLLVGGHAVAAHGRPRSTKDVDLWLEPERANIERAAKALAAFGVTKEIIEALRTAGVGDIIWMGRAPTRVDFLQSLPGLTFANALRSILRQDPDIILVGEIRDLETAQIAVQASLTGHMVFSTLHTNDAPSSITRLRDMGVEPFLITATLEGQTWALNQ